MGKIRLKVVGNEQQEQEQKQKAKARKEGKRANVPGVGLGGGQRITTVGISEEEIAKELEGKPATLPHPSAGQEETTESSEPSVTARKKSKRKAKARIRSKRYTESLALAKGQSAVSGKETAYPISSGIDLLRKFKKSNFDETVELHINTREKGISGQVTLPHGTGKKLRIAIANDDLILEIEKGKIDFDVLISEPAMMPKLAKVAKILGPRGLMPNPKAGTITDKPDTVVEKLSAGQITFKTEAQFPLIHMSVGKVSFDDSKLVENIQSVILAIGPQNITGVTLKSTMSPGIRIQT